MSARTTGRTARWLLAIGLLVVSAGMPGTAAAYWSSAGDGGGVATTASIEPPTVTVHSPALSDRVRVTWTEPIPPEGMTVRGYSVTRSDGRAVSDACGSSAAAPLDPRVLECVDTDLADGSYVYTVTADLGPWTEASDSDRVTVAADRTGPSIVLGGTAASSALIDRRSGSDTLFFRPGAVGGGSVTITAEVTDGGVGPASATFPAVTASGWTHVFETVGTGTGTGPTVTYTSSPFAFLQSAATPGPLTITAQDARGNTSAATLTVVADSVAPTGGALRVNGANASAVGTTSTASSAFVVESLTPYAESATTTASGLASSQLVRESAALAAGACGAFGGATTLGGSVPFAENGLPNGCYRYTLTGVDNVGNTVSVQTTVKLDTSAPDGATLSANGTTAVPGGATSIAAAGTWPLARTDFADADSGMTSSVLTRTNASLTGGSCGTFGTATTLTGAPTQSGLATGCYRYRLVGTNTVGLTSSVEVTVQADTVAPTGGAFTVNGTAASAASPSTNSTSSSVTVAGLAAYTDANIGLASSDLTRAVAPMTGGVCGTYGAEIPVSGNGTVSGLEDDCHRFTLRGTDLAGNTVAISRIVRVDASAPIGGALTVNAIDATTAGSTSTATAGTWPITWTLFSDPDSGLASATVTRATAAISNGVCGTFSAPTTIFTGTTPATGTNTQSGLTTNCYRYVLTTTNAFGTASTLTTIVRLDTTAPTAGAMTVNGTAASAAGSSSAVGPTSYTITVTSAGADTNSGITTSLVRDQAAFQSPGVCSTTFANPVTLTYTVGTAFTEGPMTLGCYRYTLTVTNGVGTARSVLSTVRVDTTGPINGALTINGVAATSAGSTSTSTAITFPISRTDWSDPETATVTSALTRAQATLAGGVCGAFGATTTLTGATLGTTLATNCYRYVLTGTNTLVPPAVSISTVVMIDTSAPASGAFTVNGAAASAAGTTSAVAAGGNFSVTAFTNYSETQSVLSSSTFTRTTGVSTGGVCGSFDAATTVTLPSSTQTQNGLPNGCYRYVLTGTNSFGGVASVTSTVRVGP